MTWLALIYRNGAWRKGADVPLRLWLQKPYIQWFDFIFVTQSHCCLNLAFLSYQNNIIFFFQQRSFGMQGKASLLPLSLPLAVRGSFCHSLRSRSKLLTCLEMWILERERERDRDRQRKRQKKKINKLYLTPEGITLDFSPCKKRRYNVQLQNFNTAIESTFLIWHTAMKLFLSSLKNSNSIRFFMFYFLNTFYIRFIYFLKIQGILWDPEF